jgi:hypothetical protein
MNASGGQLCARARFWASLRVDDELSELEGALLDAHLARCADCRAFQATAAGSAGLLRYAPLVALTPLRVDVPRSPQRMLFGAAAAAVLVGAALLAGFVHGAIAPSTVSQATAVRSVAIVASTETTDQLRRLRRTSLLSERRLPRDISLEPV